MKTEEKVELLNFALFKTRKKILLELEKSEFKTMSTLKKQTNTSVSNISKIMSGLEEKELVKCVNPQNHQNKLFSLTEKGREIVNLIKEV